jgi:oligopeptidase B
MFDNGPELCWSSNELVFYTSLDDTLRPFRVVCHNMDSNPETEEADHIVYEEADTAFSVGTICTSEDEQYIMFSSSSKTADEWHYANRHRTLKAPHFEVFSCRDGFEYEPTHYPRLRPDGLGSNSGWIVLNNKGNRKNFAVDFCMDDQEREKWQPLVVYDPAVKIDSVSVVRDAIVLTGRRDGLPRSYILPISTLHARWHSDGTFHPVAVRDCVDVGSIVRKPTNGAEVHDDRLNLFYIDCWPSSHDFNASLRCSATHALFPAKIFELQLKCDESNGNLAIEAVELRTEHIEGPPYDPLHYTVLRTLAESRHSEGIAIPVVLCYRTEKFKAGCNPLLITTYGSYGDCTDLEFSPERLSLLDRGIVYAVAAVRGGGELGREWWEMGRRQNRINSVYDFIDCTKHLIAEQFGKADRVVSMGGSAGGTVVAAALMLAPQLYRGVVAVVPFVDCLTTMMDSSLPLTTSEFEDWGNPSISREDYLAIKEYSPMDRLASFREQLRLLIEARAQRPRLIYIESGWKDPRVSHHEPAAFAARLRDIAREDHIEDMLVLHKCQIGSGHSGASGRYEQLREMVAEYAAILCAAYSSD